MDKKKYTGNPDNPNKTVGAIKANFTRACDEGRFEDACRYQQELYLHFKATGWECTTKGRENFSVVTPVVKPVKPVKPVKLALPPEAGPEVVEEKLQKSRKIPPNKFDTVEKRLNRRFLAQDFDGRVRSAKNALIMPGQGLFGVVQFFEQGLFDENTQLICIENQPSIWEKWKNKGFGKSLRKAIDRHGQLGVEDYYTDNDPILCKGTIGKQKEGNWEIDLANVDNRIDFVWLDFTGVIMDKILAWISGVLLHKLSDGAIVNITACADSTSKLQGCYAHAQKKKDIIDKAFGDIQPCLRTDIEESHLDGALEEFGEHEHWKCDNILLQNVLQGYLVAKKFTDLSGEKPFGKRDVQRYKGNRKEMATHKFHMEPRCDNYDNGLGMTKVQSHLLIACCEQKISPVACFPQLLSEAEWTTQYKT